MGTRLEKPARNPNLSFDRVACHPLGLRSHRPLLNGVLHSTPHIRRLDGDSARSQAAHLPADDASVVARERWGSSHIRAHLIGRGECVPYEGHPCPVPARIHDGSRRTPRGEERTAVYVAPVLAANLRT